MLKAKPTSPAAKYHYKKEPKSAEYLPDPSLITELAKTA
jgi:hypothetical protein